MSESEISHAMYKKCLVDNKRCYWENIKDSSWVYRYCRDIQDRPEMIKYIITSPWAYMYCVYVNDNPKVRKYIIDPKYVEKYFENKN